MSESQLHAELAAQLAQLSVDCLTRKRRTLDAPCGPLARVDGRELISFCSNDYLGLANDPALRARMAEANRRKYASFYTVEHYGQRMAAVFDELLARQKRGGG